MTTKELKPSLTMPRIPWWFGACLFAAIAVFFLWEEHRAHILGAIPYLLLLACPLIHLFMHGGHSQHRNGASSERGSDADSHRSGGVS